MFRIAALASFLVLTIAVAGITQPSRAAASAAPPAATQPSFWTTIPRPDGLEAKTALRGIFFLNDKIGWVCGDGDPAAPPAKQGHVVFGTGRDQVFSNLFHTLDAGKTWKKMNLLTNFEITSIATLDGSAIMLGNSGGENHLDGDTLMLKGDGPQKPSLTHRAFRALLAVAALGDKRWVAVGSRVSVGFTPPPNDELYTRKLARAIYSDDDGATWKIASGTDGGPPLRALAYGKDRPLLAVGDKGTVLLSADKGASWTKVESTTDQPLRSVAWQSGAAPTAAMALAVGKAGTVIVSGDAGKTWTVRPFDKSTNFNGVAAVGDAFVAVTAEGNILRIETKALISKAPRP